MSTASPQIGVEIVQAWAGDFSTIALRLPPDSTIADALRAAASLGVDDIESFADRVGVFGERCNLQRMLIDGDRIEIYRPLLLDAKAARRLRAKRATQRAR